MTSLDRIGQSYTNLSVLSVLAFVISITVARLWPSFYDSMNLLVKIVSVSAYEYQYELAYENVPYKILYFVMKCFLKREKQTKRTSQTPYCCPYRIHIISRSWKTPQLRVLKFSRNSVSIELLSSFIQNILVAHSSSLVLKGLKLTYSLTCHIVTNRLWLWNVIFRSKLTKQLWVTI